MPSNSLRKLGKPCEYRTRELSLKFTKKDANILFDEDSYSYCGCGCCDMYDDDLDDSHYEYSYEYLKERMHMFYENIGSLRSVFTSEFISRVKEQKLGRLDVMKVYLEITHNDLIDGYNSVFLENIFDENNKYQFKLEASIVFADFDFTKMTSLNIHIDPNFDSPLSLDAYSYYDPRYSFNLYYMRNFNMDSKKITHIYKRISNIETPEWCVSNEEKVLYLMLSDSRFKKTLELMDIKDIIKYTECLEVFRMYLA